MTRNRLRPHDAHDEACVAAIAAGRAHAAAYGSSSVEAHAAAARHYPDPEAQAFFVVGWRLGLLGLGPRPGTATL
jgi:hypothetical protein